MVTITGGKWTTYRHMAEDCVNVAATLARLPERPCVTHHLRVHGCPNGATASGPLRVYGSDASAVQQLQQQNPEWSAPLHPALPYTAAEVVWAAREELALTVEDVLSRRTRALLLNARAALTMAPAVSDILQRELGRDDDWKAAQLASFNDVARHYLPS
jgi:glycerol-3-phosphate dehydrogenase